MSQFVIEGPSDLSGEIKVLGAKNAAMKMISACVLIKNKVVLENVPDILDIKTLIDILTENGAVITRDGHTLTIDTANLTDADPNPELVEKMRGSIVLIGPYLARLGQIALPKPGGCAIGSRPIDIHLDAFRQFGVAINCQDKIINLKTDGLAGHEIKLQEASVTATENILMAAVLAQGQTTIDNAAREPEIVDLANFLNQAGAKISGAGTSVIAVDGVRSLNPVEYRVMPDKIEAATFITLAVASHSLLKITACQPQDLTLFLDKIKAMGAVLNIGADFIEVQSSDNLKAVDIATAIFPGFATDWQSLMGLLMTKAEGTSHINETLFENRLGYLKELQNLGAKVNLINNHEAEISGPTKLHGGHIESLDLRAGATLLIAGLAAVGETIIDNAEIIDRGYEKIEERLVKIGARIKRI